LNKTSLHENHSKRQEALFCTIEIDHEKTAMAPFQHQTADINKKQERRLGTIQRLYFEKHKHTAHFLLDLFTHQKNE